MSRTAEILLLFKNFNVIIKNNPSRKRLLVDTEHIIVYSSDCYLQINDLQINEEREKQKSVCSLVFIYLIHFLRIKTQVITR